MGSISQHKLPIINFNKDKFEPNSRESWVDKCKSVRGALEEYGCFVGVFDTISTELHDSVFSAISELFELPTQTKIQNKSTKPLYGYVGQIPFIPLYESLGIDYSNTAQGIQNFTNVMWPHGNQKFSETLLRYTKLAAAIEQMVVRMIFESYGVEKYHDAHLKSTTYLFRAMKYRAPELNESNMGFVAHTDKDFVTILHQNQVNGLEIKAKDGTWFTVELEPSSYIVMAGEAAMAWSNNRMYSPYHRVTMNYGKEARYSIAQFSFMEGKLIETPEELVDEEHPLQFKPFDHLKFLAFYDQEENRRLTSAITTYCGVGHAS